MPFLIGLLFILPILFVIGCGSTSSDNSSNVGSQNQGAAIVQVQGVAPAGTPGGGAAVAVKYAPKGMTEYALSLISRPARAQTGGVVLSSFLATAFDARGQAFRTVTTDANGSANFSDLPPGIYRILFFNTNFPTTFIQTFVSVQAGVPLAARADAQSSAATMVVLNIARGLNVSNVDVPTLFAQAQRDPNFQNAVNILIGLLRSGQPNFNQGTGGSLDPQLGAAINLVAQGVLAATTGGTTTGTTGTTTTGTTTTGTTGTNGTGGTSTGGTGGTTGGTGGTSTGGTGGTTTGTGGTSTGGGTTTGTGGTTTGGTGGTTTGTGTGGTSTGG